MPGIGMSVTAKGPLFERGGKIVEDVTNELIQFLLETAEQHLDNMLRPPPGVYISGKSTGNYRRHITSTKKHLSGFVWDGNVMYGPWLEGVGSRNKTSRFKGHFHFRKTQQQIIRKDGPKAAKRFTHKLIKRLGG
jgi:hypothetical protein